jgi:glycosyltransferase involved in cell wall biosynthesis
LKLSIVICTWRRARALAATLTTLAEADPPDCDWEVIVISNDCSAETAAVVRPWIGRMPLRLVEEPTPGLSHARNRGVAEAAGDYIIWADDDVLFDRGWLRAYERAFREKPEAAFFGGTIIPVLEGNPPAWLIAALPFVENIYAARRPEVDLASITSESGELPFGANYAVRAAEQSQHLYDVRLGRRPGNKIVNGEETKVMRNMVREGHVGAWAPAAILQHMMPPERQTHAYFRRYYEDQGWQRAAAGKRIAPAARRIRYRLRMAYYEMLFLLLFASGASPIRWLKALRRAANFSGRLRYYAEQAAGDRGCTSIDRHNLLTRK